MAVLRAGRAVLRPPHRGFERLRARAGLEWPDERPEDAQPSFGARVDRLHACFVYELELVALALLDPVREQHSYRAAPVPLAEALRTGEIRIVASQRPDAPAQSRD